MLTVAKILKRLLNNMKEDNAPVTTAMWLNNFNINSSWFVENVACV